MYEQILNPCGVICFYLLTNSENNFVVNIHSVNYMINDFEVKLYLQLASYLLLYSSSCMKYEISINV